MPYSAYNRNIYNCYKKALGTGEISSDYYTNNISAIVTDINFEKLNPPEQTTGFDFRFKNFVKGQIRTNEIKGQPYQYEERTKFKPTRLNIEGTLVKSYNKGTRMTSETTYEQITNRPCSSKIFTEFEHNNSWVTHDLDWTPSANKDQNLDSYWKNEYAFNTDYNIDEYRSYDINQTYLDENIVCLSALDFWVDSAKGNPNTMDDGAAGLLLVYHDETHEGDNAIPMMYMSFPKVFYSNYNYLEIDWNQDGIIKVE